MKQNVFVGATLIALCALLVAATGGSASAQGSGDDPGQVTAGKAIFETNCAGCHGVDGMGSNTGRPLIGVAAENDRSRHITSVTEGRGAMPAFGDNLSAEEIGSALSYVRLTFVADAAADSGDAAADEGDAPAAETTLAVTGAETPFLAVGGVTVLAAGALLVGFARRERDAA